ncbi:hypothetical protein KQ44_11675 [Brachyspira sp. G79]|nr:hypothetical protein KQ44_11675 [Brachyspira sp. G79]
MLKLILISYKNLYRYILKYIKLLKEDTPLNLLETVFYFFNIIEFIFFVIFQIFYIPLRCLITKERIKYFLEIVE